MAILTADQIYAVARQVGFNENDAVVMTAISLAESGGNTTIPSKPNKDGSIDFGLWQINSQHWPKYGGPSVLSDPIKNGGVAYQLYLDRLKRLGNDWKFTAWSVYNNGAYKSFLGVAAAAKARYTGTPYDPSQAGNVSDGADNSGGYTDTPSDTPSMPSCDPIDVGAGIKIPNFACEMQNAVVQWKDAHVANYLFVLAGLGVASIGLFSVFVSARTSVGTAIQSGV